MKLIKQNIFSFLTIILLLLFSYDFSFTENNLSTLTSSISGYLKCLLLAICFYMALKPALKIKDDADKLFICGLFLTIIFPYYKRLESIHVISVYLGVILMTYAYSKILLGYYYKDIPLLYIYFILLIILAIQIINSLCVNFYSEIFYILSLLFLKELIN